MDKELIAFEAALAGFLDALHEFADTAEQVFVQKILEVGGHE